MSSYYGQNFSNKTFEFGGGYHVWKHIDEVATSGGTIEKLPNFNYLYPAGMAVELTEARTIKAMGYYQVTESAAGTSVKLLKGNGCLYPIIGRFLMVAGDNVTDTGKGVSIENVTENDDHYLVELSDDLGSLDIGDILQDAAAEGASVAPYAIPNGLMGNDKIKTEGDYAVTSDCVVKGTISKYKMPVHPESLEKHLSLIHFDIIF